MTAAPAKPPIIAVADSKPASATRTAETARKANPKAAPNPNPASSPPPRAKTVRHKVAPGETLSKIARKYGRPASAIAKANGISNPNMIRVGQVLQIPPK